MNLDNELKIYLTSRIEELQKYPTSYIINHAKNLVESYSLEDGMSISKRDLDWMMTYIKSSKFIDCHNLNEDITNEYIKSLEYLAKIEYRALKSNSEIIYNQTQKFIDNLNQINGCYDI